MTLFSTRARHAAILAIAILTCSLVPISSSWASSSGTTKLALLACGNDSVLSMAADAAPLGIAYGMNMLWWNVDTTKLSVCASNPGATTQGAGFLAKYDNPIVRNAIRSQLAAMRQSGFTELRVLTGSYPNRTPGFFQIDEDVGKAGNLLRQYVSDVAAAGFRSLEIEYGTDWGGNRPPCGLDPGQGGCFDRGAVPREVSFIVSLRRALGNASPIPLRFDLINEACNSPYRPAASQTNLDYYLRQLVPAYVAAFPQDQTTVSCDVRMFREGKPAIDGVYQSAGRSGPDFYEIHVYPVPNPNALPLSTAFERVRDLLAGSRTPVLVGETVYGDPETIRQILYELRGVGGGLLGVYFWPKRDTSTRCNADVAPPYVLKDALGQ